MKVITFSYVNDTPPAEATVVLDFQLLPDSDTSKPMAQEIPARAREHASADAVIAFGCGFGQDRSVNLARRFIADLSSRFRIEVEHRALNQRFIVDNDR